MTPVPHLLFFLLPVALVNECFSLALFSFVALDRFAVSGKDDDGGRTNLARARVATTMMMARARVTCKGDDGKGKGGSLKGDNDDRAKGPHTKVKFNSNN
jgi:hypothetical protein